MDIKQGVVLTGRNHTGPPCSVGRPTADAPGCRPVRPPAALQTPTVDDDGCCRQTTDHRRHRAKQYWPIRRASNKRRQNVSAIYGDKVRES